MVTLKLNGPRRRESERAKNRRESGSAAESEEPEASSRASSKAPVQSSSKTPKAKSTSAPSAMSTGTSTASRKSSAAKATPASSPTGDTIAVHHRAPVAKVADNAVKMSQFTAGKYMKSNVSDTPVKKDMNEASIPIHASKRSSLKPVVEPSTKPKDLDEPSADDSVTEYDFRSDAERHEDEDDGQDTRWYKASSKDNDDVITISSDSEKDDHEGWDLSRRPWKEFDLKQREIWELMYCNVTDYPMNGDWAVTEDYQREKDQEILRYMEDFPLPEWVLPQHDVMDAYNRLLERTRWRSLGIRIYGRERIPEFFPGSTQTLPMVQTIPYGQSAVHAPQTSRHFPMMPPSLPHRPQSGPPPSILPQTMSHPPPNTLSRSQSMTQSTPPYPNGLSMYPQMARPGIPGMVPSHLPNLLSHHPNGGYPQASNGMPPTVTAKRKSKARKAETPPTGSAKIPALVPPYPKREKPAERETIGKLGRRKGKAAEAEEFPWNRDLDFIEEKANATWDDSIYDPATLASMAETRLHNGPIIERIDAEEAGRQRESRERRLKEKADDAGHTRNARKTTSRDDPTSEAEQVKKGGRRKSSQKVDGQDGAPSDSYHSGYFCFVPKDQPKVIALGNKTPDEVMLDAEAGRISIEECADLMICWNPGKKGGAQDLQQARFSIKDTLLTRKQVAVTPILVSVAAERIVDFCPDMLWRSMLLRICSEAGKGNKWVRDRMCLNGNYCDKATITKRLGAALGQKQQQSMAKNPKPPEQVKGYAQVEAEYYNGNSIDHGHYIAFFGLRTSHRSQLIMSQQDSKRKAIDLEEGREGSGAEATARSAKKRKLGGEETISSSNAVELSDDVETGAEGEGSASGSGSESDVDAVSVQSDTILDELDD